MNLLWAFNFNKATDAEGKPIEVDTWDYVTVNSYHSLPVEGN
jgi:hypothetical protein